jgi:hypothetical protein
MITLPSDVQHGATLLFDVCIAGAGAAGITLAIELETSGFRVCLLEAGGLDPAPLEPEHPFAGDSVGMPYDLLSTRLRFFGGTTNHWGGWCRPLDDIDFEARPGVRISGWPIVRAELDDPYRRAAELCEIDPPTFELPPPGGSGVSARWFFDGHDPDFVTRLFRFSPPTRFGVRYREAIDRSRTTTCFLHATVVEVVKSGREIDRFHVISEGKPFDVRARIFVLACGAIENARLLLESDRHDPGGIGNEGGFVGRCFADHMSRVSAQMLVDDAIGYVRYRSETGDVLPHLCFSDAYLAEHGLVNFGIELRPAASSHPLGRDYLADKRLYPGPERAGQEKLFHVIVRFEPTPNPSSRVTLTAARDRYGMRRVRLDWQLNAIDTESLDRVVDGLARKCGRANVARVRRIEPNEHGYQAHQLGTTRMSPDAKSGVVDARARVHSTSNLYIAGSSVFPSFGFANPTLTIVALAVRLASHLRTAP